MRVVLNNRVFSPPRLISFLRVPLVAPPSMKISEIPPVIPTRVLWLVIMFFVGVLGLIAQVCLSTSFFQAMLISELRRRF